MTGLLSEWYERCDLHKTCCQWQRSLTFNLYLRIYGIYIQLLHIFTNLLCLDLAYSRLHGWCELYFFLIISIIQGRLQSWNLPIALCSLCPKHPRFAHLFSCNALIMFDPLSVVIQTWHDSFRPQDDSMSLSPPAIISPVWSSGK